MIAVLAAMWFSATPSVAQTQPGDEATGATMPRTIVVIGEGTASGQPDMAQVTIGVEVAGPDAQQATSEANQKMEAVLSSIREQGIAEADIQTTGFNIFVERSFDEQGQPSEEVTYRVSNNATVKVRDLEQVSTVLGTAIEAGANNIYGVTFSLTDTTTLEQEALQEAVNNASAKAQKLAEFANVELGDLVSISETIHVGGIPQPLMRADALSVGMGGGPPISPGELDLVTQVQVVYSIQ
jgi:uncharacterized protein YggE